MKACRSGGLFLIPENIGARWRDSLESIKY
jgi:hypothetical protein